MKPALACAGTIIVMGFTILGIRAALSAEPVWIIFVARHDDVCRQVELPAERCSPPVAFLALETWLGAHDGMQLRGKVECLEGSPA